MVLTNVLRVRRIGILLLGERQKPLHALDVFSLVLIVEDIWSAQ